MIVPWIMGEHRIFSWGGGWVGERMTLNIRDKEKMDVLVMEK